MARTRPMDEIEQALLIPEGKPEPAAKEEINGFALVELFGHARIVGFLSERALGNTVLLRVDVPDLTSSGKVIREGFTRYFGPGAIYSVTMISEERMRNMLPMIDGTPCEARPLTSRSYSRHDQDDGY